MESPRDITDEFDDDALRASIQKADKDGEWRDPGQGFQDPKLEALRKQLSEPTRETYTARRMRELQEHSTKAAPKVATPQDARAQEQAKLESVFAEPTSRPTVNAAANQLAGLAATGPAPRAPAPAQKTAVVNPAVAATAAPKTTPARPEATPLAAQLRLVMPALVVFGSAALLQLMLAGWRYDIPLRVPVAGAIAAVAWHKFGAGWLRGGAVGGAVHLLTFFLTSLAWSTRDITANAGGLLAAVIGSCVVGMIRKANSGTSPR